MPARGVANHYPVASPVRPEQTYDRQVVRKPNSLYQTLANAAASVKSGALYVYDTVCPRNPVTKRREIRILPVSVELFIGRASYNSLCPVSKVIDAVPGTPDGDDAALIKEVFDKLVIQAKKDRPEMDWNIRYMRDDETANAFCLPGGYVTITSAMVRNLKQSITVSENASSDEVREMAHVRLRDKLAGVLGHEIGHACAGHGVRKLEFQLFLGLILEVGKVFVRIFVAKKVQESRSPEEQQRALKDHRVAVEQQQQAQATANLAASILELIGKLFKFLAIQGHSQACELESDGYGIQIAQKAGYNAWGAVYVQYTLMKMKGDRENEQKGWLTRGLDAMSSHPPSAERLQHTRQIVRELESGISTDGMDHHHDHAHSHGAGHHHNHAPHPYHNHREG